MQVSFGFSDHNPSVVAAVTTNITPRTLTNATVARYLQRGVGLLGSRFASGWVSSSILLPGCTVTFTGSVTSAASSDESTFSTSAWVSSFILPVNRLRASSMEQPGSASAETICEAWFYNFRLKAATRQGVVLKYMCTVLWICTVLQPQRLCTLSILVFSHTACMIWSYQFVALIGDSVCNNRDCVRLVFSV